jgi:hypothetical protein
MAGRSRAGRRLYIIFLSYLISYHIISYHIIYIISLLKYVFLVQAAATGAGRADGAIRADTEGGGRHHAGVDVASVCVCVGVLG